MGANEPVKKLKCFKAYDIRGQVPEELNSNLANALGRACARTFSPQRVVVGYDARLSGPELENAFLTGLESAGIKATSLGMCGTEEIYYAAANHPYDLGIMITGSHNPANENGFKIVRKGALPVSRDSGLDQLEKDTRVLLNVKQGNQRPKNTRRENYRHEYVNWLLAYTGIRDMVRNTKPLKILVNAGNGCAGLVLKELEKFLPFDFIRMNYEPDGNFPNGVPNPLLSERRAETSKAVIEHNADIGVAFDGDFDRCFFYDQNGKFLESYYLIGLLARQMLAINPGGKIVHDTRVYWNTREEVLAAGGIPIMGKTGHAFMKEKMRAEDAIYGGEMSAHHYFRDFAYCDSGMLTMLLLLVLLQKSQMPIGDILEQRIRAYPCSGELNFRVNDAPAIMSALKNKYIKSATHIDQVDGINMEFPHWRFNLRSSNTEPLLRLNVESRGNEELLTDKTREISDMIENMA